MDWVEKLQLGLEIMGKGMGGIFLVILITMFGTMILTKIKTKEK